MRYGSNHEKSPASASPAGPFGIQQARSARFGIKVAARTRGTDLTTPAPQLLTLLGLAHAPICIAAHQLDSTGKLRPVRISRRLLFDPDELAQFIQGVASAPEICSRDQTQGQEKERARVAVAQIPPPLNGGAPPHHSSTATTRQG